MSKQVDRLLHNLWGLKIGWSYTSDDSMMIKSDFNLILISMEKWLANSAVSTSGDSFDGLGIRGWPTSIKSEACAKDCPANFKISLYKFDPLLIHYTSQFITEDQSRGEYGVHQSLHCHRG